MKPVAWIKVRELAYMKAVIEHGKEDWQTNLGLKPEPDDEGLYTETQVQQLRESFEQSVTDPENQPSQYGTVPLDWHLRDEALLRQAYKVMGLIGADLVCEAAHHEKKDRHAMGEPCPIQQRWHETFAAIKERLK